MASSKWWQIISWLVALGVPMTPLQGTYFGYAALLIAAGLSLWRGLIWVKALNIQIIHKGHGTLEPLWVKIMFLAPTFLLFLIAGLWSYYGGLSVFGSHSLRGSDSVNEHQSSHLLAQTLIKNYPRTSPPIERHVNAFVHNWLMLINKVRAERTRTDLQAVVQEFGRLPVSLSGNGLVAEARFTLLALEKEGYVRIRETGVYGKWWGIEFENLEFTFVHEKLSEFIAGL